MFGSPQSPDKLVHGLGDWVERGLPLPVSPFGSATLTTKSWGCSSGGRPLHRSRGLQWHQWCLLEAACQHSPVSPPVRLLLFIDLLLRAILPSSCLYSLSKPKREAMERYLSELLATGLIRPLPSLVGSGFFFVKKDSSLRPCIDYWGLNDITAKNRYHLPLLDSAFVGADLRQAGPEKRLSFRPDPKEATEDAGALWVLSRAFQSNQCPFLCFRHSGSFFSRWLTPAERNYDAGNRKLHDMWTTAA